MFAQINLLPAQPPARLAFIGINRKPVVHVYTVVGRPAAGESPNPYPQTEDGGTETESSGKVGLKRCLLGQILAVPAGPRLSCVPGIGHSSRLSAQSLRRRKKMNAKQK